MDGLLRVHWKQWSALGVASQILPEENRIIDLEPLIASTQAIGAHDRRLLLSATEWIERNDARVNHSRLHRIQRMFSMQRQGDGEENALPVVAETVPGSVQERRSQYRRQSEKIADFFVRYPSHLQFRLRGLLGITASADVLLYLLIFDGGNSNAIAEEICHDQKNVYRILEQWAKTGIVKKAGKRKDGASSLHAYHLIGKQRWGDIFEYIDVSTQKCNYPNLHNWRRTFLALDRLAEALSDSRLTGDEYLMSTHFRDIHPIFDAIGTEGKIDVPSPKRFQGSEYFAPFALAMIRIVEWLSSPKIPSD
ncbi:MAG: hypothetical protein A2Z34_02075 [Planctomycetes bacterium RBG_16_59_8]|nr:MAG: hypothetical protein A2Z34_02075 [Planctomycetes bacterium RBG_16_59_8]